MSMTNSGHFLTTLTVSRLMQVTFWIQRYNFTTTGPKEPTWHRKPSQKTS